jgi:HSP20 family molecular chaperone IbpA
MAPDFKIATTDNGLEISGEIHPKLGRDDLRITVEGRTIRIQNNRVFSLAPCEQVLDVPEVYNLTKASAAFDKGVLRIRVPKKLA